MIGALGLLAGCENTTTAIGACEGGDGSSNLVEPKPIGPVGLPLPRPDNSVTWAITDDNKPIADGVADEGGPLAALQLRRLHRSRHDQEVREAVRLQGADRDVQLGRRGDREAGRPARSRFDVIIGLSGSQHRQAAWPSSCCAAQPRVPDEPEEHLARAAEPVLRQGSRYTVPYVVWSDGIGWRNDKIEADIPRWRCRGTSSGSRRTCKGKVGLLDDNRDGLSMPMQRAAMRQGGDPRPQHRGSGDRREGRQGPRPAHRTSNIKVAITDYQTLPEGKTWLHHSWSGDLLAAAFYYMPKGVAPERALVLVARRQRRRAERLLLYRRADAKKPALAHHFLELHPRREERVQELHPSSSATRRRRTDDRRRRADQEEADPRALRGALVRPDQFSGEPGLLALTSEGERPLGKRLVEVQGRLMQSALDCGVVLAFPGVAWLSVFFLVALYAVLCVAFGNQDTLGQPVPFWNPLDWNVGYLVETLREHLGGRAVPDGLHPHVRLRRDRARPVARDRLPGRLLRGTPRRPLEGPLLVG